MHPGRLGVRQKQALLHLSQSQLQVSPDPEHRRDTPALSTQLSKGSCHNRLLKICCDEDFMEETVSPQGKGVWLEEMPGRCCLLRWIEACPPSKATSAGHSSDPNHSSDAALKAKEIFLAIRKCGLPFPTWEENRQFLLFQKDLCSEDVPLLLELCPAPSEKKIFLSKFVFSSVF